MQQWVRTLFLIGFCLVTGLSARAEAVKLTDLAGRQVSLATPVERLVISEGRYLSLLALLQPSNPVRGVVGMMTPLGWTQRGLERQLFAQFPTARDIPLFGGSSADSVSVGKLIDFSP